MDKERAIRKLSRLKNFKKYRDLNEKTIELATKIINSDWIKYYKEIELRTFEDHISIDRCILGFIPIVYITINNSGKLKLGHYIDEYRDIPQTKEGQIGIDKVKNKCDCFNFLCGEVEINKKEIEERFLKEFRRIKKGTNSA